MAECGDLAADVRHRRCLDSERGPYSCSSVLNMDRSCKRGDAVLRYALALSGELTYLKTKLIPCVSSKAPPSSRVE